MRGSKLERIGMGMAAWVSVVACQRAGEASGAETARQDAADGIVGGKTHAAGLTNEYVRYRIVGCREVATGRYVPPDETQLTLGERYEGTRARPVLVTQGGSLPAEIHNVYSEGSHKYFFAHRVGGDGWQVAIPLEGSKSSEANLNYYRAGSYTVSGVEEQPRVSGSMDKECDITAVWVNPKFGVAHVDLAARVSEYRARVEGDTARAAAAGSEAPSTITAGSSTAPATDSEPVAASPQPRPVTVAPAPTAEEAQPPPPTPEQPARSPVASPPTEPECFPPCRTGYVCVRGQCVSACNPPCPPGRRCSAEAECI